MKRSPGTLLVARASFPKTGTAKWRTGAKPIAASSPA